MFAHVSLCSIYFSKIHLSTSRFQSTSSSFLNHSATSFSPLAGSLGFVALPPTYWLYLTAMLVAYVGLTQVMKVWFIRRFGE